MKKSLTTILISALLALSVMPACAESFASLDLHGNALLQNHAMGAGGFAIPFIRFTKPELAELGNAYRVYGFVKYSSEIRQGYLVAYVNNIELDRAREKIMAIEAPFVAKQPDLDTKEVFDVAIRSLTQHVGLSPFMSVDAQTCHFALRELFDGFETPTGNLEIKKDF
jgi:hypothetical protein